MLFDHIQLQKCQVHFHLEYLLKQPCKWGTPEISIYHERV